jgi:tripartite-type tricarboxylate transporter receptor subunit TctC
MGYGKWMYGPCVRSDSPFKSLKDLIEYAKANPGKIKCSVPAIASPNTFGLVHVTNAEGFTWEYVIFKGGMEATAALLGGHVALCSATAGEVVPHIQTGKLRLLVSMSETRWPWVPDVPTLRELGYNFHVGSYLALGAPKGVPNPIMDKLRAVFKKTMNDPEFLEIMKKIYIVVEYRSADEYKRMVEEGYKQNEKMILELGLHKSQKK